MFSMLMFLMFMFPATVRIIWVSWVRRAVVIISIVIMGIIAR